MIRSGELVTLSGMDSATREAIASRLRTARAAKFGTVADAARALNMKAVTIRAHESGQNGFTPAQAAKYAVAYGVHPNWILYGGAGPMGGEGVSVQVIRESPGGRRPPRRIPVLGEVAAGVWRETDPREARDAESFVNLDVPGFERGSLFALRVVGRSMDMFYPEGRVLIIAPVVEAPPQDRDHVVVMRSRAGLYETTVKELVLEPERMVLWPRSTDPAFQAPLIVNYDDQDAPIIVGVVVADYGRRQRSGRPAILESWAKDGSVT